MQRALAAFRAVFGPVWRDERGVTLAITAVTMTALLAITGLAVDAGWWYALHRQNQSAADASAISAGYELLDHGSWMATELTPFATTASEDNGYSGTTPDVSCPTGYSCTSGAWQAVQVVLH